MNKKLEPPSKSAGDYIHSTIHAAAGAVPIAGSFLSEFFSNVIAPPYEKRKTQWMEDVANCIATLESNAHKFDKNKLKENEEFLDAMISATKSAIASSSKDKHEQLLNALQNVALGINKDKIANAIFLNLIDKFTEAHIVICKILENPNDFRQTRGDFETKETYRELINKKLTGMPDEIMNVIVKELHDNDLINISAPDLDNLPEFMHEGRSRLTNLGKLFLQFISKPNHAKD